MVKNKTKNKCLRKIEEPIITAIKEGNFKLVQNIINKAGLDFSATWTEGYALLCTAIIYHQSEIALWLLMQDCRINNVNKEDLSDSPLHLAIYYDKNSIAEALIKKGACLNAKNQKLETPLHISCQKKNITITKMLLKDDSIVNTPDSFLSTPLHIAVENECLEIIELILNHKVNVDAHTIKANFEGFTPLHIAIFNRNEKIIKMLLENGADIHAPIRVGHIGALNNINLPLTVKYQDFKPLHLATEIKDDNIMELLIKYNADIDAVIEYNGKTAVHIAVENKNKRNVILLSEYNVNFKAVTNEGKNVLHLAVENDWPELVEVLLVKGADVNIQTVSGATPLHIAVEMGDETMIELLLEYNADVNITNSMCQSPLHTAAEFSANIVRILLDRGANVDEVNNNNETPLNIAVQQRDLEIITEILHYRPALNNISNQFALIFAIKNNDHFYVKVVDLLLNYGFTISEDGNKANLLHNSVSEGNIAIVKYLLEYNINIFEIEENNYLLHNAVISQNYEMVKLFIKYKCNIHAVDKCGKTPVDYAIEYNNIEMLKLLLSRGAKIVNITMLLLNTAKDSNYNLLHILLQYGVDINVSDEFGITPLHFAVWNENQELTQLFLDLNAKVNTTEAYKNVINNISDKETDSYTKEFRRQVFTSPLHIAVGKKNRNIYIMLLEKHANINSTDGYGRTALHIAAAIKSTKQKNIIQTLINYGADINSLDAFKRLPIYYIYDQTCVCSVAFQNQYEVYSECECDLYLDYDINDVIEYYVKHITLLVSMNKFVHSDNFAIISKSDFTEKLQISCLDEIQKMKEEKIDNCLSFYDILIKKSNALIACARNEKTIQVFESNCYMSKFPLYCDFLKDQFDIAQARIYWFHYATLEFNSLLNFNLPELIAENIFEYLSLNDLQNISKANDDSCSSNSNTAKKCKVY